MLAHAGGRARQGRRHRDVLHLRRPHRRHLVARAATCPVRTVIGRDGRLHARDPGVAGAEPAARRTPSWPARPPSAPARRWWRMLRESGDLDGEPEADPADDELLREGRQAARDRLDPPVVHPQRRPRRRAARPRCSPAAPRSPGCPTHMKHRYDNWVGGLNGDWLISRQRFFGIPFPVWYPLDAEGEPDYDHPLLAGEDELPVDPSTDVPAGLHRGPARQARRLHRRPRRDGHLGDLVADAADRRRLGDRRRPVAAGLPDGPVPPRARHHPHLAVLPGRPRALRERHARRGRTP